MSLTGHGQAAAARFDAERAEAAAGLLGDVPPTELNGFIATAERLLAQIAEFTSGTPAETTGHEEQLAAQS